MILVNALRRAAETLGPENIDAAAVRDYLATTDMPMESQGWGNDWKYTGDVNSFAYTVKLVQYNSDQDKWLPVEGYPEWQRPPTLGG